MTKYIRIYIELTNLQVWRSKDFEDIDFEVKNTPNNQNWYLPAPYLLKKNVHIAEVCKYYNIN